MTTRLPPRVKGIDANELRLLWGRDKIILVAKGATEHFTLHFGPHSKVLDVHRTQQGSEGSKLYERLFSTTHEQLASVFSEIAHPLARTFTGMAVPFAPALMRRRDVTVIAGIPLSPDQFVNISKIERRRLTADPTKLRDRLWIARSFDDLQGISDGEFFAVVSRRRNKQPCHLGYGFATSSKARRTRLFLDSKP